MDYGGNLYLLFIVYIIGIHNKSYFQHPTFNLFYSLKYQINIIYYTYIINIYYYIIIIFNPSIAYNILKINMYHTFIKYMYLIL